MRSDGRFLCQCSCCFSSSYGCPRSSAHALPVRADPFPTRGGHSFLFWNGFPVRLVKAAPIIFDDIRLHPDDSRSVLWDSLFSDRMTASDIFVMTSDTVSARSL